MAGLPKIVRHRLGQALGSTGGVDHPDANLLAGFVERSLTPRERGLVLGHLAQCAECREQVSVALPKLEAAMVPAAAAARHWPHWLRWPVLRWSLLVASLAIMGTVALVRQPPARRMELASRVAPPSTAPLPSDVTIGAAPSKAAKPEGQPRQEIALLKEKLATRKLALGLKPAQERKQMPEAQELEVQAYEAARPSQAQMAAPVPAEAFRTSPSSTNGGGSNQPSTAVVAQALPPPPAPMPAAAPPPGQPAQKLLDLLASPQAKQAEASRASEEDKGKSAGGPVGEVAGGVTQVAPAETESRQLIGNLVATPNAGRAALAKRKSGPVPAASAAGLSANASSLVTVDWSISPSGRVQRSRDGRKTWEELNVDKNVVFRVVFAVGPDVWLGGTKGALYHSTDGGQHWTRVSITTGSTTATDDVVHVEFKDAQHGTVKMAGGDTWTTLDGAQHWEKQ